MTSPINNGLGSYGSGISSEQLQADMMKELGTKNANTLEMAKVDTAVTKANKWGQVLNKAQ